MTSPAFGAFIDIDPSSSSSTAEPHVVPIAPQRAFERVYHSVPLPPGAGTLELNNIDWSAKQNRPKSEPNSAAPSGAQTPHILSDLEMSLPVTPRNEDYGVSSRQSFSSPPMNRFRMTSVCLMNLGNGLNDSAPGALLPFMESHYGVGYAMISVIFVTTAVGFIAAAFFVDALRARLGRSKTLILSQSLMILGYITIVCTPPFPAVVVAFLGLGFGMAVNLAMGNVFAANLHNGTKMLGFMHGSYGIGGTVGPLVATALVADAGTTYSRYYLLTLSVSVFNLVFAGWAFWHYEAESATGLLSTIEQIASQVHNSSAQQQTDDPSQLTTMIKAFKSKAVLLGALFIFAYQGAEVSISGWVISFLIENRHGREPAVGYVSSGFWAGITVGRFVLSHPAHKIGEKFFVYGVIIGAIVFELLVWLVPNVVGEAVAVAIVGLFLGPIYPCATAVFSRAIARKDQVSGLSVISAFGSSGGAVAPLVTGILAQAVGTFVLHPIVLVLFTVMIVCWFGVPNVRKRMD